MCNVDVRLIIYLLYHYLLKVGNLKLYAPCAKEAEAKGTGGIIHVDVRFGENSKVVKPTYFVHSRAKTFLQKVYFLKILVLFII